MNDSGCLDCKKRTIGCHSTCETYRKFKEKRDYMNRKRRETIATWKDGHYQ